MNATNDILMQAEQDLRAAQVLMLTHYLERVDYVQQSISNAKDCQEIYLMIDEVINRLKLTIK